MQINPYLNFDGKCREAMTFYKECFGGELDLQEVGKAPWATNMPPGTEKKIMHSTLTITNKFDLMASDMVMGESIKKGNDMYLCLIFTSKEDPHVIYNKLAAGGDARLPLNVAPWGDTYGELTDKFGVKWMFNKYKE